MGEQIMYKGRRLFVNVVPEKPRKGVPGPVLCNTKEDGNGEPILVPYEFYQSFMVVAHEDPVVRGRSVPIPRPVRRKMGRKGINWVQIPGGSFKVNDGGVRCRISLIGELNGGIVVRYRGIAIPVNELYGHHPTIATRVDEFRKAVKDRR